MPATSFQYATPASISGATSWSGAVSDVDEAPPFNDSDVMASPPNSSISGVSFPVRFNLTSAINPNYYTDGWNVLLRAQKSSASNTQTLQVEFLDTGGGVVVSSSLVLTNVLTDRVVSISAAQAAAIVGYAGTWSIRLTAPPPSGSGSNFVVLSGVCLQLPTLGFVHLIPHSSNVGWQVVGAHSGSYVKQDVSNVGYKLFVGSETTGSLYYDSGDIKAKL